MDQALPLPMPQSGAPPLKPPSLWRNPAFVRLWFAKTISGMGSVITGLAVPITAVEVLGATPAQMAGLAFAGMLPDIVFGLLAGVWVDRVRRRPLLIGADLGRAVILLAIPVAAFFGMLSMPLLWIVAFGSAALTLVFTLASVAVLPAIVRQDQLVDANTKLQMSESVLTLAGPGLAGLFVQLVTAPRAILADVGSFIASAWALGSVGSVEPRQERAASGSRLADLRREIGEGLHELVRTPMLRALAISMGVIVAGANVQLAVQAIFLLRVLELTPLMLGVLSACNGVGSLLGAGLAGRLNGRFPLGKLMIAAAGLNGAMAFAPALAGISPAPVLLLASSGVLSGIGYAIFSVNQISLRQRITPLHLLGRVTSARRFLIFCIGPLGAALGGWLGTVAGVMPALVVGAVILFGGTVIMWFSPVRHEV
ncbi:MAG TPA: MFS transporter [Thermomicrobiales bacterium]|nr:MFS transporter [Thermomicrobiales bacterium]